MKTRNCILCALFAALTAVGGFVRIPFPLAALTLQFLFTAMAGCLLGAGYGALSQAVYVLLGLAGVPVFALGGGLSYVLQPTFGYVLGLIPAAWLIGWLTRRGAGFGRFFAAMLAGLAADYAVGLPYLALIANGYLGRGLSARAVLYSGLLVYLPGDLLKLALAAAVCSAAVRRLPRGLLPGRKGETDGRRSVKNA